MTRRSTVRNPLDTPSAREIAKAHPEGSLLAALIGTLVFGGVSAFMTGVAPVSRLEFRRENGQVAAHVETYVFFRWPYRVTDLASVTGVEGHVKAGEKLHRRAGDGQDPNARAESQGSLTLRSNDREVAVTVHHSAVKSAEQKVTAFLADANAGRLELLVETHPIIGTWVPILFTIPMTLLCVFGLVAGSIQRMMRRFGPITTESNDDATGTNATREDAGPR